MRNRYFARPLSVALGLLALTGSFCRASTARADEKSGVEPTRIHLPKGPGSLEGIGENASANLAMGLLQYDVPIAIPDGYGALTPSLALRYNSGGGNGNAGIGWDLHTPSIERMTKDGIPLYGVDDRFVADGGEELSRIGASRVYRASIERSFVRYTWVESGTSAPGAEGYWKAEYPDGRVGYFGATSSGALVEQALVRGPQGIFRYHLCEMVDPVGHHVLYQYDKDGASSILKKISYVYEGATPRYQIGLSYETRPDTLSDARGGFNVVSTERLTSVRVFAHGKQLRRYALTYEPAGPSIAPSRLAGVRQYGLTDNDVYPIEFHFAYSGGFASACTGATCTGARVVTMDNPLGIDLRAGDADFVDINGDALPDVVSTKDPHHAFFINHPPTPSAHAFDTPSVSAFGDLRLSSGPVNMLDVNGDGFSEMVDSQTGTILWNLGTGEWAGETQGAVVGAPAFDDGNLRFFDYNNDKRVDIVHADRSNGTWYYENAGNGEFRLVNSAIDDLGVEFETDGVALADMNGDGMLDLVRVVDNTVSYRLNMGRGKWTGWTSMGAITQERQGEARFVDVNGDGLSDAVILRGDTILVWLNRNGATWDSPLTLISGASLPFPITGQDTAVRFADMNGNGSIDIAWIDSSGKVTYLELFPQRPNLLTRMTNAIGKVIEVTYGSSVEHMARDASTRPWSRRLPHVMQTVDAIKTYDTFSVAALTESFHYRNGVYDRDERRFRGFTDVEVTTTADGGVEPGFSTYHFAIGDEDDPYSDGNLLDESSSSGGQALRSKVHEYRSCPLSEVAGAIPEVRFMCPMATHETVKEGRPANEWVTLDQSFEYDGYGNRTRLWNSGVTAIGGAPCGAACLGDEEISDTTYAKPSDGSWLVNRPSDERVYSVPGSTRYRERIYHYDGDAYMGLPVGQVTRGLLSRLEERVDESHTIDTKRFRYDALGAVAESIDGNGHHRTFEYDPASLFVMAENVVMNDAGHAAYSLRTTANYDSVQDTVIRSTAWQRSDVTTAAPVTTYTYDAFARLKAIVRPGDSSTAPTEEYLFGLADPLSRVIHRTRSVAGASAADLEEVQCFDGMGRVVQTRTKLGDGTYQVSGLTVYDALGKTRRNYQPYKGTTNRCDTAWPTDVHFTESTYDSTGRPLVTTMPDAALYGGTPSRTENVYAPLRTIVRDEENVAGGLHPDMPVITTVDGLGRTVAMDRYAVAGAPLRTRVLYDDLGHVKGYVDAASNTKLQENDFLGRIVRTDDPDSGTTKYSYDGNGNLIERADARGVHQIQKYDEAGRLIARWDAADPVNARVDYAYDASPGCAADKCTNVAGLLGGVRYALGGGAFGQDYAGYDARGQAVYTSRSVDGATYELSSDYDNAGRLVGRHYPNGKIVTTKLDGLGRPLGMGAYVPSMTYDPTGQLATLTYGNGVKTTYGFDARSRLASIDTALPGGDVLQAYRYTRDRTGNIVKIADSAAPLDVPSANAEYDYDGAHHLTAARLDPARSAAETLTFTYDAIDNVASKTSSLGSASPAHVGTYVYGEAAGPHALTSIAGSAETLKYDAAGNLAAHGGLAFTWDYAGRMVGATRDGAPAATFSYGAAYDRVRKIEDGHITYYVAPDYEVRDGSETIYVMAGGSRVAKIEPGSVAASVFPDAAKDGVIRANDAWLVQRAGGASVDGMLAASAKNVASGAAERVTYLHHDHQGTIAAVTDAAGAVVQRTETYPFGQERYRSAAVPEEYTFTGKERDESTGLHSFGARYLDARLGRWASVDPKFERVNEPTKAPFELASAMAFVMNNPMNRVDPDGMQQAPPASDQPSSAEKNATTAGLFDDVTGASFEVIKREMEWASKINHERGMVHAAYGSYGFMRESMDIARRAEGTAKTLGRLGMGIGVAGAVFTATGEYMSSRRCGYGRGESLANASAAGIIDFGMSFALVAAFGLPGLAVAVADGFFNLAFPEQGAKYSPSGLLTRGAKAVIHATVTPASTTVYNPNFARDLMDSPEWKLYIWSQTHK